MEALTIVIFGITSNLAQIKLIPALFDISRKGLLPKNTRFIGIARGERSKTEFTEHLERAIFKQPLTTDQHPPEFTQFAKQFDYLQGDVTSPEFYAHLQSKLSAKKKLPHLLFYFATFPELYQHIFAQLSQHHFHTQHPSFKMVIEKPLGIDLESARSLNKLLLQYFSEDQIYRVDHYLGKETVQNILSFRFANSIFEPLMHHDHIDHIQITAAEQYGANARSYYDKVGALKDVGQNHILQMLAFVTMDAPAAYTNEAVTKERIQVLSQLDAKRSRLVFGQYHSYRYEHNIDPESDTDTFFALKTFINTPRLQDVPIYIRAGKKLAQSVTEVSVVFKVPHTRLLKNVQNGDHPNVLTFRIQPNEGVQFQILVKKPGHELELKRNNLQFCYHYLQEQLLEPYEHILYDAMQGNQTFFNDAQEVETQWAFIDELLKNRPKVEQYQDESWGPESAQQLIEKDGRSWLPPAEQFCHHAHATQAFDKRK